MPEAASVAQLRQEAHKARVLAAAAFGEEDSRQLREIAATLDREAALMESVLGRSIPRSSPPTPTKRNISL